MPMEATTNIIVRTPDVFLTASEVAEILGISRPFAYKIIKRCYKSKCFGKKVKHQ